MPASDVVALTCGGVPLPRALTGLPTHALPARPTQVDVDPLLAGARRVVVVGTDADLAAVLLRLLRTERLDVELAHVAPRPTAATRAWGLPHGAAAAELARGGTAVGVALVRDDHGGVLVGAATVGGTSRAPLHGEAYCDDTRVFRGDVTELRVRPCDAGVQVLAVGVPRLRRLLDRRGGAGGDRDRTGGVSVVHPGAVTGRALQLGCTGAEVVHDGVAHGRVVPRWAYYRHTDDWRLVRPS